MSRPLIILDFNDTMIMELEPSPYKGEWIDVNSDDMKAIARAQSFGWFVAIITNQAAIEEKKHYSLDQFMDFMDKTIDIAAQYGVNKEEIPIYVCPHSREEHKSCRHGCRKPGVAHIVRLFNEHGPFDLERVAFIGDKPDTDLEVAIRCGFTPIQVRKKTKYDPDFRAAFVASSLAKAIDWLEKQWRG